MFKKKQPVYDESDDSICANNHFPRSESCPSLQLYRSNVFSEFETKRTLSDYHVYSYQSDNKTLLSRHSETDLSRINKTKTFREKSELPFDTGDVLARVVRALGNIAADDECNDSNNLLNTETITSALSVKSSEHEYSIPPEKPRSRAVSAYRKSSIIPFESSHKWTWNGTNAQIQEFRNMRHKLHIKEKEIVPNKNHTCSVKIDEPCPKPFIQPLQSRLNPTMKNDQLQKLTVGHHQKRYSIVGQENLPLKRRPSRIGYLKPPQMSSSRRPSIFDIQENQADKNLLENTTIADLIRVLETAHTLSNSCNDPALQELLSASPKRSSRRASMYPRYSEQHPLRILLNGKSATQHCDQLPLPKPVPSDFAQRRFSVLPNPLRRSSLSNSTMAASMKQRRQSMRPSSLLIPNNNSTDITEVTGRFTVSKRLRPTNSFRMQNNFLRRTVAQSSQNSLSELNEK